jgi:diguanylate cyclase
MLRRPTSLALATDRAFRIAAILAGLSVIVFVAWVVLEIGGPHVTAFAVAVMLSGAPLLAGGACFSAARSEPYGVGRAWSASLRRAWRLLGMAALCWGLGQVMSSYLQLVGGVDAFPSMADLGSLCAVPVAAAAMLAFPTAPIRATARFRTLLDSLLVAACLLFLSWATVLGDAYRAASTSTLERAVALAYPLGDIVIGTTALMLLIRSRHGGVHLSMIALAVLALAVSDSGFAYLTQIDAYQPGTLLDSGWLVGWLLFLVAAFKPNVAKLRRDDDQLSLSRLALPYVILALAAVAGLVFQAVKGGFDPFLIFTGTGIGVLVIARQIVALVENRQLNQRLQNVVIELSQREQELKDALRRELSANERLRHELSS